MCVKAFLFSPPSVLFFSPFAKLANAGVMYWSVWITDQSCCESLLLVAHKVYIYISSFLYVAWKKKKINVNFVLLLTFVLWLQFLSQAFFPDIHHHSLLHTGCKTTPAALAALIPLSL